METIKRDKHQATSRLSDPYRDRRSGEDRRKIYSLDYFTLGGPDRRSGMERRYNKERRQDCIRVDEWSSVCPDKKELFNDGVYIIQKIPLKK